MKKINRCCGITKNGKNCKKTKRKGDAFCGIHTLCVICLEQCTNEKKLNCCHSFCKDCIAKWSVLEMNFNCPVCRKLIDLSEQDEFFDYGIEKMWYSLYTIHQYNLRDPELIKSVMAILEQDTNYSPDEWTLFKNYIFLDPSMEEKLNNSDIITYTYYKPYDDSIESIIKDGISCIDYYRIIFEI